MSEVTELQEEVIKKNLFIRYLVKMRGGERAPSRTNFADGQHGFSVDWFVCLY